MHTFLTPHLLPFPTQKRMATNHASAPRAGLVLFNSNRHVLLLKDKFSTKWGFPKGAQEAEDGNDLLRTAVRECAEETGLHHGTDYILLLSKKFFKVRGGTYFLGLVSNDELHIKIQESEIDAYCWMDPFKPHIPEAEMNHAVKMFLKKTRLDHISRATRAATY
jgi:8-oxo-dGTP pyrophosphatase MutT (NUDIX family)